jgi:hypothetical protein
MQRFRVTDRSNRLLYASERYGAKLENARHARSGCKVAAAQCLPANVEHIYLDRALAACAGYAALRARKAQCHIRTDSPALTQQLIDGLARYTYCLRKPSNRKTIIGKKILTQHLARMRGSAMYTCV